MSHWNHRVIGHVTKNGEPYYEIHEVYYDDDGKVNGWTDRGRTVSGDSVKGEYGLAWVLEAMREALDKPVLMVVERDGVEFLEEERKA